MRLLATDLPVDDVRHLLAPLLDGIFDAVPSGVGSHGSAVRLDTEELHRCLREGARWAVERGLGEADDAEAIESGGRIPGADPAAVSGKALARGLPQLGSLGSGNHFVELGRV